MKTNIPTTDADTIPRNAISAIIAISLIAFAFLVWLIYFQDASIISPDIQAQLHFLPGLNASLNAMSTLAIILGIIAIKNKKEKRHMTYMLSAFIFSTLFLLGYIVHHTVNGDTLFLGTGFIRYVYFFILISHVLLTTVTLPLILLTFFLALTKRLPQHKKIARWTAPLWLYISITGVLIYIMLRWTSVSPT